MSNLEYKGFKGTVKFSAEDDLFIGRVIGIKDFITFEGSTVIKLKKDFKNAIDFHIEICKKEGKELKKVYSGKVFLRVNPDLHAKIAETAGESGKSINEWGNELLEEAVS